MAHHILNICFFIKGQFICGDKRCTETEGLRSWEASCKWLWLWHFKRLILFSPTECREWRKQARQRCCSPYVKLKQSWPCSSLFFVYIPLFSLLISTTVKPPLTRYNSHFFWQIVHTLTRRVLSRIYRLAAENSRVAKGDEVPRGFWGHAPRKLFEMNMHWDTIWCILRHNFAKCYSVCTNLVMSGWFFWYSYLYTVSNDNNIFWGGSFYPSNILDRTLTLV